jgi:hypothetical protein
MLDTKEKCEKFSKKLNIIYYVDLHDSLILNQKKTKFSVFSEKKS